MVTFQLGCNGKENIAEQPRFLGVPELKGVGKLIVCVQAAATRNALLHRRVERAVVRKLDRADPRKSYCARVIARVYIAHVLLRACIARVHRSTVRARHVVGTSDGVDIRP